MTRSSTTPREMPALDLGRMRAAKAERLRAEMDTAGAGGLWLTGPGHVRYALGPGVWPCDAGRASYQRTSLVWARGAEEPHLFTPYPEGAPVGLSPDHVHAPLFVESEAGVRDAARRIREVLGGSSQGPLALDEQTPSLFFASKEVWDLETSDATPLVAAAKLCKTPDEIECVRRAQRINELAMLDVQAELRPGLRQSDLSALFFSRIYELGAAANGIDPIWQVMPERLADGPYTTHGQVGFPTCTTDRLLRSGDVIWVDTGIEYCGYNSDFGRTWIVGEAPSARQEAQFQRWRGVIDAVLEVLRPGVTGRQLTRAAIDANGGEVPWLPHFYLLHGTGSEPAEMPLLGTDLGDAFDESVVVRPGMVLVLEPAIWDDGDAGYRSEEIVAITEDGWTPLSDHTYAPYAEGTTA